MRFGIDSFSAVRFGNSPIDASTIPAIVDLIADQEAPRAYLFKATPYDAGIGSETTVRASLGLKRPILNSEHWPAILKTAADSQVDLFGEDESAQGNTSFGNIELLIGDQEHDELPGYFWDGRSVEVMLGGPDFAFEDYRRVLFGTAEDVTFDQRRLSIAFRGKESLLDKPVQETLYAGTGGLEGGDDIAGSEKPLTFGPVPNLTPVLVDRVNQVYQFHDGAAQAVTAAFDGAAALTSTGDVADITTATVAAGYYKTQLSGGYIKLGAVPAKALTINAQGDSTGGYIDRAPDIIKRISLNYTDQVETDLNLPAFFAAVLDSSRAACGVYIRGQNVRETVTELMGSIGGAWTFNRLGLFTPTVFRKRRAAGTITVNDIVSLSRARTVAPSWQRRIGYGKAWTVQADDQLVASADDGQKDFATNEYRFVSHETASIKNRRPGARVVEKTTLLANKTDAQTEVDRQQSLYGQDFDRFDMVSRRQQFKYHVGQTITVDYPRFGFPRDAIILGVRENTSTRRTSLRLWTGPATASAAIIDSGSSELIVDPADMSLITDPAL